jgi:ubiquinone/menaquinone biosynthesis C-methylase UbiE
LIEESIKEMQKYWNKYATGLQVNGKTWGSKEFFAEIKPPHDKAYAYANQILNLANLEGRSLLELGCGIGLDTVEFARHGAEVTAIDLAPNCIDLAKRFLTYRNLTATFGIGNAEELPYPPDIFDVVIARGLFMYTPNDSRVVDEIFRVLKPGGEANILLHNRFSWYVFLAKMSGTNLFNELKDPPVNKLYSVWKARKMFAIFSSHQIFFDRFPSTTAKRTGIFAQLYNQVFVPFTRVLPNVMIRPLGYYIIVKAIK